MASCRLIRGEGDKAGDPINDPLLTHDSARCERGRVEIDRSTPAREIDIVIRLNTAISVGDYVRIDDSFLGPQATCLVTGIDHRVSGPNAETLLTCWNPEQ